MYAWRHCIHLIINTWCTGCDNMANEGLLLEQPQKEHSILECSGAFECSAPPPPQHNPEAAVLMASSHFSEQQQSWSILPAILTLQMRLRPAYENTWYAVNFPSIAEALQRPWPVCQMCLSGQASTEKSKAAVGQLQSVFVTRLIESSHWLPILTSSGSPGYFFSI